MSQLAEANFTPNELREAPRISLMLRAAKLVSPVGEFLCILRDVSATGIKARMFHPLPTGLDFELELGSGQRFALQPVWEREGHAGFRFVGGPIDLAHLIDEAGPFPKRQLRLKLDLPTKVTAAGRRIPGRLRDLSQHGALIELDDLLPLRQLVSIDTPGLPRRHARVRWRRGRGHGLVFHEGFRLDELACLVERLQNSPIETLSGPTVN